MRHAGEMMSPSPKPEHPTSVACIDASRCTRCLKCLAVCSAGAISDCKNDSCSKCVKYCLSMPVPCKPGSLVVSAEHCTGCGECIAVCEYGAIGWAERASEALEPKAGIQPVR